MYDDTATEILRYPGKDEFTLVLRHRPPKTVYRRTGQNSFRSCIRIVRFCVLIVLLPALLVAVPIYLRYRVYGEQMYALGMTDMRLVDHKVSTTWCQKQLVRANGTFNAFLLAEQPKILNHPLKVSMTRRFVLEDDMKEYWAFYLLQGSSVTVSTCVRWPGASLIIVRGHKHLKECAYIGDDSSEEIDEQNPIGDDLNEEVKIFNRGNRKSTIVKELSDENEDSSDGHHNIPQLMRRIPPEVVFDFNYNERLLESSANNLKQPDLNSRLSSGYQDPQRISEDTWEVSSRNTENERHATDRTVIKDIEITTNFPANETEKIDSTTENNLNSSETVIDNAAENNHTVGVSSEIFEDIYKKLQNLGIRGKNVLRKLNEKFDPEEEDKNGDLRRLIKEEIDKQYKNLRVERNEHRKVNRRKIDNSERKKRQLLRMQEKLTRDDDDSNAALEEDLQPDGIADHHKIMNQTTANDASNSEFWSSFSSSEEALLKCAGLILNLPLSPHHSCQRDQEPIHASLENTITYRIPHNGYYYFVFGSENEVQPNYIRADFHLEKLMYNVSSPVVSCENSTESCSLPLNFFSREKAVLELPLRSNDSLWNEEFVAVSTCEPRTALYVICVLSVPVLILLCAFQ